MLCRINGAPAPDVVKRMMYLAWQACKPPMGLPRVDETEESVWKEVWVRDAAPYEITEEPACTKRASGDYLHCMMVKLHVAYGESHINVPKHDPRPEYQGWMSPTYPSFLSLAVEAAKQLGGTVEVIDAMPATVPADPVEAPIPATPFPTDPNAPRA